MKKILITLLCLPMIFSCGDTDKVKDLEDRISELENKIEGEANRIYKPTKREMNVEKETTQQIADKAQEMIDNAIIPGLPANPTQHQ